MCGYLGKTRPSSSPSCHHQLRRTIIITPSETTTSNNIRANTGVTELSGTISRLEAHYYDRLYLNVPTWYDDTFINAVKDNYVLVETIPSPAFKGRYILGYQQALLEDTLIFEPR